MRRCRKRMLTTVFSLASKLASQTVPVRTKPPENESRGLILQTAATFRSSILSERFHKKYRYLTVSVFFMEARRIELLSENLFTAGSPSAVCVQDSPGIKHTNKLYPSVASLFMGGSKLCRLTFTAQMTLLAQMR